MGACNIVMKDEQFGGEFHTAAHAGIDELMEYFVGAKLSLNYKSKSGLTPLHCVCYCDLPDICKFLLVCGVDVDILDDNGYTPLYIAVWHNNVATTQVLLSFTPSSDSEINLEAFRMSLTLRYHAIDELAVNRTTADMLFNYGFRFSVTDIHDVEIIDNVITNDHVLVMDHLLSLGLDPNFRVPRVTNWKNPSKTLLQIAVANSDKSMMRTLLAHGADINVKSQSGQTVLFNTVILNDYESTRLLLCKGINVNAALIDGTVALHYASEFGYEAIVDLLLQYNAGVNVKSECGSTPLHCAAYRGWYEVLPILLSNGADVHNTAPGNLTSLHVAVLNHHPKSVLELLNGGADPDAKDRVGRTPLHIAAMARSTLIIKCLLAFSADIYIKDNNNKSPYDYITDHRVGYLSQLLQFQNQKLKSYLISRMMFKGLDTSEFPESHLVEQQNENDSRHERYDPTFEDPRYEGATFKYYTDSKDKPDEIERVDYDFKKYIRFLENRDLMLKKTANELSAIVHSDANTRDMVLARELLRMQRDKIHGRITMYDIMTKNYGQVSRYMLHDKVLNDLASNQYLQSYPYFFPVIRENYLKAKRFFYRKQCEQILKDKFDNEVDDVPLRHVVKYLTNSELEQLGEFINEMKFPALQ